MLVEKFVDLLDGITVRNVDTLGKCGPTDIYLAERLLNKTAFSPQFMNLSKTEKRMRLREILAGDQTLRNWFSNEEQRGPYRIMVFMAILSSPSDRPQTGD